MPLAAQEDSPGRRLFLNACGVCHTVEPGAPARQGPSLSGIFGKIAGAVADFKYSDALKTSNLQWDEPTLDAWLTDPQAVRQGVTMLYRQANPERRKIIIDYLKTIK